MASFENFAIRQKNATRLLTGQHYEGFDRIVNTETPISSDSQIQLLL